MTVILPVLHYFLVLQKLVLIGNNSSNSSDCFISHCRYFSYCYTFFTAASPNAIHLRRRGDLWVHAVGVRATRPVIYCHVYCLFDSPNLFPYLNRIRQSLFSECFPCDSHRLLTSLSYQLGFFGACVHLIVCQLSFFVIGALLCTGSMASL